MTISRFISKLLSMILNWYRTRGSRDGDFKPRSDRTSFRRGFASGAVRSSRQNPAPRNGSPSRRKPYVAVSFRTVIQPLAGVN